LIYFAQAVVTPGLDDLFVFQVGWLNILFAKPIKEGVDFVVEPGAVVHQRNLDKKSGALRLHGGLRQLVIQDRGFDPVLFDLELKGANNVFFGGRQYRIVGFDFRGGLARFDSIGCRLYGSWRRRLAGDKPKQQRQHKQK